MVQVERGFASTPKRSCQPHALAPVPTIGVNVAQQLITSTHTRKKQSLQGFDLSMPSFKKSVKNPPRFPMILWFIGPTDCHDCTSRVWPNILNDAEMRRTLTCDLLTVCFSASKACENPPSCQVARSAASRARKYWSWSRQAKLEA